MNNDYQVTQKIIHWLMATLIILDLFVAQKFGGVMSTIDRLDSRVDHSTMGLIVLSLFLVRLYLRFKYGSPKEPETMPVWQTKLSKAAHHLLYLLMAILFISGLCTAINATSPITLFGLMDITRGNTDDGFFQFIRQFHETATMGIIVLISIHIVAALYHHFIVRDEILTKMIRFKKNN